jgi:hypothetical protein
MVIVIMVVRKIGKREEGGRFNTAGSSKQMEG